MRGDTLLDTAQHARRQRTILQVMQSGQLQNAGIGLDGPRNNLMAGAAGRRTPRQANLQGKALFDGRRAAAEVQL